MALRASCLVESSLVYESQILTDLVKLPRLQDHSTGRRLVIDHSPQLKQAILSLTVVDGEVDDIVDILVGVLRVVPDLLSIRNKLESQTLSLTQSLWVVDLTFLWREDL